jgi:hypothetical protein
MGFGAAAFGKRFRRFSVASLVTMLVAGGLTARQGGDIGANKPTPWSGCMSALRSASTCCGWRCWPLSSCAPAATPKLGAGRREGRGTLRLVWKKEVIAALTTTMRSILRTRSYAGIAGALRDGR